MDRKDWVLITVLALSAVAVLAAAVVVLMHGPG